MSRTSARKVKLTSKYEEFNTTRLASIHRSSHPTTAQQQQHIVSQEISSTVTETKASERQQLLTPKLEQSKTAEATPQTREKPVHKVLRQKAAVSSTPATPVPQNDPPPSTPYNASTPLPKLTANGKIRGRPRKCWQKAETAVKPMSSTREELLRLREENANLKTQLEQKTVDYEELKRQTSYTGQTVPKIDYDDLKEKYQKDLTHAKRHEWCVVCLNPSRYHCCWNTTYCSQKCQVSDWYLRHVKSCERRRALKKATY